jgi:hypothetical protein
VEYFANPSSAAVREAMTAGRIGMITTPKQGNRIPPGAAFIADNGRYSGQEGDDGTPLVGDLSPGWPGELRYVAWLAKLRPRRGDCRFAVAPDQPFDMARTLDLAGRWLHDIRAMGFPAGLALQNGAESMPIPWADCDVVCLAGDTAWKTSPAAAWLARRASDRGIPVHMLRVNSLRRIRKAWGMGCDYCDGGYLRYPDTNLPKLLSWLDDLERNGAQMVI